MTPKLRGALAVIGFWAFIASAIWRPELTFHLVIVAGCVAVSGMVFAIMSMGD